MDGKNRMKVEHEKGNDKSDQKTWMKSGTRKTGMLSETKNIGKKNRTRKLKWKMRQKSAMRCLVRIVECKSSKKSGVKIRISKEECQAGREKWRIKWDKKSNINRTKNWNKSRTRKVREKKWNENREKKCRMISGIKSSIWKEWKVGKENGMKSRTTEIEWKVEQEKW